jgi:hypothetical protein
VRPSRRARFLAPGAGLAALAAWASDDSLTRRALPEGVAAAWRAALGAEYATSSLLLPAAAGFAHATRHASAVPPAAAAEETPRRSDLAPDDASAGGGGGGASSEARAAAAPPPTSELGAALLAQPAGLRALCALAGRTPGCGASQDAVATALRCVVRRAADAADVAALIAAGAEEALPLLARNFRDSGAPAAERAVSLVAAQLAAHAAHPGNKRPNAARDDDDE